MNRMSSTPQLNRGWSLPSTPRLLHNPDCRHHPISERAVNHEYASDGSSTAPYATPIHHRSGYPSYGTLQSQLSGQINPHEPSQQLHVVEISTPTTSHASSAVSTNKTNMMITWTWMTANVLLLASSVFTLLQPYWLINKRNQKAIGIMCTCDGTSECSYFQSPGVFPLTIDSLAWQIAVSLMFIACVQLIISGTLAALCICLPGVRVKERITWIGGYLQLVSAVLLLAAMLFLPAGFDAEEVRQTCGYSSDIFTPGNCSIGWSYVISIITSCLCPILPILSHYVTSPDTAKMSNV